MQEKFYIHQFPVIKGPSLDLFLASGWYRYGSQIFTTNLYEFEGSMLPVYWMRYRVNALVPDNKSMEIIKRGSRFSMNVSPFQLTEELDQLHEKYFEFINFPTAPSLDLLLEDTENRVYDTHLITLRDENHLVAAGIFDFGRDSIAGIKNIFDPAYKKYSPGKLLMLLKYQYCLNQQITWYYPGYLIPGCNRFDYKLFLDKNATELLDPETLEWKSFESYQEKLSGFFSF